MMKKVRLRTILIGGVFTLFFVAIVVRVYWIQVVQASWLMEKAEAIWESGEVLKAQRGSMVDRNNKMLAEDGLAYTVIVDPQTVASKKKIAEVVRGLSALLQKPEAELMQLATKKKPDGTFYRWVEIRNEGWKIDSAKADEIKEHFKPYQSYNNLIYMKEYGIYLEESHKRYYPSNAMAAHVLGYYDKQEKAVMGLEALYDDVLRGTPGKLITEKDLKGNELPNAKVSYHPAADGKMLKLTIDKQIQSYIETAMDKAYDLWKPKSMSVVAVNPQTMEVLGLANLPNFDPNHYWDFADQSNFFNHAIGSQYEPGSTFKLVTLAATVEEGLFNPNDTYLSGQIKVPGAIIHDYDRSGWGTITYLEGLKRSSNVAFVKLGYEKLGEEKLRNYIAKFGYGEKTGIDLPGETKGLIQFRYPSEVATAAFGQGKVSVTTIQQVAAFAAIANGGKLMKPYVVKEMVDQKTNEVVQSFSPTVVRQVVSEQTARKVSEYLEQVVADQKLGTGRNAYIEGYRIAGKTGTANKVINGSYATDKWAVSFIGYAPVEDPKILIAVVADEPDLHGDYREGGKVTLPVFKEIMSQSLRYLNVSSHKKETETAKDVKLTVPDLSGMSLKAAKSELNQRKLRYEVLGGGASVLGQFPIGGTETGPLQRIYIMTEKKGKLKIPNLAGMSLRDALELCGLLGVECQPSGEGYVKSQNEAQDGGKTKLLLELEPLGPNVRKSAAGGDPSAAGSHKEKR